MLYNPMKKTFFALLAVAATLVCACKTSTVSVADFGAIPDDGINDADALRKAAEYCRTHPLGGRRR